MNSPTVAPALIETLFASLLDDAPWVAFLDAARDRFDANFATLILTPHSADRPGMLLTPGADDAVSTEYRDGLFAGDPFTGLPDGVVCHFRDFLAAAGREGAPEFKGFIARTGDEILGVDLHQAGDFEVRLRLRGAGGGPRFEKADAAALQAIVPHVRIAARLFDRLTAGQVERRIYSSAIEQLSVGMIILSRDGRILSVNPTAEALLARGDGIARRGDRIALADRAAAKRLDALFAGGADDRAEAFSLRIPRRDSEGDLNLSAASAEAPAHVVDSGGPAIVLYLSDPREAPRARPEALKTLLGLTQSEALVAAALADGSSLTDAATRLGISHNTVRAHLRAIYAKTGVNRQSRLVTLIHQSLAGLSGTTL